MVTEREGTKVVIYFESFEKKEICPTVEAFRTHRVAGQRPAYVVMYDYYDQTKQARYTLNQNFQIMFRIYNKVYS